MVLIFRSSGNSARLLASRRPIISQLPLGTVALGPFMTAFVQAYYGWLNGPSWPGGRTGSHKTKAPVRFKDGLRLKDSERLIMVRDNPPLFCA